MARSTLTSQDDVVSFLEAQRGRAINFVKRLMPRKLDLAEDVVQEAEIAFLKKAFELDQLTLPYYCGILRHKAVDRLNSEARQKAVSLQDWMIERLADDPGRSLDSQNLWSQLQACIARLSFTDQRLLEAKYWNARGSLNDLANELGLANQSALSTRLKRIFKKLRVCLEGGGESEG